MTDRRLVVAPIAKYAVADAGAAYEASRRGYRARFVNSFEEVVERLVVMPESSPVIVPDLRRALFPRPFPFCVLYRVTPSVLYIVDVLPTAADPARWRPTAEPPHT